jgi:ankyrin repeat protein
MQLLFEKGASIDRANSHGCTALYFAITEGNFEVARLLIELGADIEKVENITDYPCPALTLAVKYGHPKIVKLLIEKGVDINKLDYAGSTALVHAIYNNSPELVQILIDNGADINKKSGEFSPIEIAKYMNNKEIIDILKNAQSDL